MKVNKVGALRRNGCEVCPIASYRDSILASAVRDVGHIDRQLRRLEEEHQEGALAAGYAMLVRSVHVEYRWAHSSPRIMEELKSRAILVSLKCVKRFMWESIRAWRKRHYKATTGCKYALAAASSCATAVPGKHQIWWMTDITPTSRKLAGCSSCG